MDLGQLVNVEALDPTWSLVGQGFAVILFALLFDFVQKRVVRRLQAGAAQTRTPWDDALLAALQGPASALIWLVGIAFAAEIIGDGTQAPIFEAVPAVRDVGVILIITWFLFRFIGQVEKGIAEHSEVDATTADAIGKLVRVSVAITAALIILQTLGFSISGLLAFGGVGGIAVGFAARDLLANFFGGLMIYLDRPFAVGDWVRSPDREIEGVVENIGWRISCIRTFDKRPLYIPNSAFANIAVENPSRMSHRRIYETIGVRYDDVERLPAILGDIERMLRGHPEIDSDQTLMVNFNSYGASSLDFFIYTFTRTTVWTEYHRVKQDVLLRISEIILGHGAEIAFPTTTVHVPEGLALHEERTAGQ